jgi:hypothetical protein
MSITLLSMLSQPSVIMLTLTIMPAALGNTLNTGDIQNKNQMNSLSDLIIKPEVKINNNEKMCVPSCFSLKSSFRLAVGLEKEGKSQSPHFVCSLRHRQQLLKEYIV